LCRYFEPDLSEVALSEHCGLLAWSPLARGILSGKYLNGARPAGARLSIETRPEHRVGEQTDKATQKYIELANSHSLDPCQMALAFVNSRSFVSSTLIGATTMAQLRRNIDSISISLSEDVLNGIEAIRREYPHPY
jgi:aryl-alcohol dehydrogenase-like predicted oxidoreductase